MDCVSELDGTSHSWTVLLWHYTIKFGSVAFEYDSSIIKDGGNRITVLDCATRSSARTSLITQTVLLSAINNVSLKFHRFSRATDPRAICLFTVDKDAFPTQVTCLSRLDIGSRCLRPAHGCSVHNFLVLRMETT